MALSEIEKLERRYAENPQGLTFAPLAEVHRKNGDVSRALELLRAGLTLHPDYIPASIVLGRCHLDLGDLPSAEAAFAHVLSLDGENVIALKALADIAERQYRFDEAERWLRMLVAVDRSNDEARDQLSRVEASRRQAEVASSASPEATAPNIADAAPAPAVDALIDVEPAAGAEVTSETSPAPTGPPAEAEPPKDTMLAWVEGSASAEAPDTAPLELQELDLSRADETERPAGIEMEHPVTLEEPVEPLSGLVGRDDQQRGADLHVSSDGWQVETAEDIVLRSAGGGEFQVANASEELLSEPSPRPAETSLGQRLPMEKEEPPAAQAGAAERGGGESAAEAGTTQPAAAEHADLAPEVTAPAEAVADASTERAAESSGSSAASVWGDAGWSPPVAEPPSRSEADLLVTESMAELLVRQGHTAEAMSVYRHLESRTGDDRFRAKLAELEGRVAPAAPITSTAPAEPPPAAAVWEAPVPEQPSVPTPAYSVQQTHGQSVTAFLRGVLGARPPAAASAPHGSPRAPDASSTGAPTRPAHDSLSLSSVFGEESTPTPPAVPATGAAGGAGGVSYDEFFGTTGSAPARPSRTPDAQSDDLDQFHAWLQNLKR